MQFTVAYTRNCLCCLHHIKTKKFIIYNKEQTKMLPLRRDLKKCCKESGKVRFI